jgi:hypothetical protein
MARFNEVAMFLQFDCPTVYAKVLVHLDVIEISINIWMVHH